MSAFFTDDEVAEFQQLAEERMVDTCRITKPGAGKGPFNQATGKYDPPDPEVVYEGKCCIPKSQPNAATAAAGEAAWQVGEYPFAVPLTDPATAAIAPGMTVEYLTARYVTDLAGRRFGVVAPLRQTTPKDRRFKIKEPVGSS